MADRSDTTVLPQYLNQAQLDFIGQKTPRAFIKTRPGPGGKPLSYVEVGYIINTLNQIFGWDWDFRILDQQVGKKQVWVRGELSVRAKGHTIVKGQFGGADIKLNRISGEPVSIADDLKAAASDCLKKCASMLGIAGDVYWKDLEMQAPESEERPSIPAYSHKVTY
ncbi:MAG: RAD52 family DNA repair protein [Candidatus Daviesbacteria bacterium]|nr:RAD52 family DNA repair protein [Candidatus Daviesbacteria bacterium]